MSSFDWVSFLEARSIDYATKGPNVSRGRVAVPCPFCGDDPSQHMTINLSGAGWGCWRNREKHSGKNPVRLVQALLRCTRAQAETIVYGAPQISNDFEGQLRAMMQKKTIAAKPQPRPLPKEFFRFEGKPSQTPFINYMLRRRFPPKRLEEKLNRFDIRYCTLGEYAYRIMFPVRMKGGYLAWAGRTISPNEKLRYKSDGPIGHGLLWADLIRHTNCNTIVLVEGPFDALKVNVLGRGEVCSTCFFTNFPSAQQLDLLYGLLPRFRHRYVLLDNDMQARAAELTSKLSSLNVKTKHLPSNIKDPGEISSSEQLQEILQ